MKKRAIKKEIPQALEFYRNIIEQVKDLAMLKHISMEAAALILILNELRQLHWHIDRLDTKVIGEVKEM